MCMLLEVTQHLSKHVLYDADAGDLLKLIVVLWESKASAAQRLQFQSEPKQHK